MVVSKRPRWARQIRSVDYLRVGMSVTWINSKYGYTKTYKITAISCDRFYYCEDGAYSYMFFADCGLEKYTNGWNDANYLVCEHPIEDGYALR